MLGVATSTLRRWEEEGKVNEIRGVIYEFRKTVKTV
ncbi:hypothetical protein [Bacillus arachidis]